MPTEASRSILASRVDEIDATESGRKPRARRQCRRAGDARRRVGRRLRPRADRRLVSSGMELGFWRIAMRPGKPLMHGRLGRHARPGPAWQSDLIDGLRDPVPATAAARFARRDRTRARISASPRRLAVDVPANGVRQDYMRASLSRERGGNSGRDSGHRAGFLAREDDGPRRRASSSGRRTRRRRRLEARAASFPFVGSGCSGQNLMCMETTALGA